MRGRLPDRYVVLFEVGWILRRADEQAKDGEADFLVCDPDSGYLCIEVKGGGIAFDGVSVWVNNHSTTNANGSVSKL